MSISGTPRSHSDNGGVRRFGDKSTVSSGRKHRFGEKIKESYAIKVNGETVWEGSENESFGKWGEYVAAHTPDPVELLKDGMIIETNQEEDPEAFFMKRHRENVEKGKNFLYVIDLDERGEFRCHVENENRDEIWSASTEDNNFIDADDESGEVIARDDGFWPVEDGFMKSTTDTEGLEEYLKSIEIIPEDAELYDDESEFINANESGREGEAGGTDEDTPHEKRTYTSEFPDFQMDPEVQNFIIESGFEDDSWHNDEAPKFRKQISGGILEIWIFDTHMSLLFLPEGADENDGMNWDNIIHSESISDIREAYADFISGKDLTESFELPPGTNEFIENKAKEIVHILEIKHKNATDLDLDEIIPEIIERKMLGTGLGLRAPWRKEIGELTKDMDQFERKDAFRQIEALLFQAVFAEIEKRGYDPDGDYPFIPGKKYNLDLGESNMKNLRETGEWSGDEEDQVWIEHLLEMMKAVESMSDDFKIDGEIRGFDKYQGPYGHAIILGKRYKIWTAPELFDGMWIENFPVDNTGGENTLSGFEGPPISVVDAIESLKNDDRSQSTDDWEEEELDDRESVYISKSKNIKIYSRAEGVDRGLLKVEKLDSGEELFSDEGADLEQLEEEGYFDLFNPQSIYDYVQEYILADGGLQEGQLRGDINIEGDYYISDIGQNKNRETLLTVQKGHGKIKHIPCIGALKDLNGLNDITDVAQIIHTDRNGIIQKAIAKKYDEYIPYHESGLKEDLKSEIRKAFPDMKDEDFDRHETDLYVKDVPGLRDWLKSNHKFHGNISAFENQKVGGRWLDIPFEAWDDKYGKKEGYSANQLQRVLDAGRGSEFNFKLKVYAGEGNAQSNWIDITEEDLEKIISILELKESFKEDYQGWKNQATWAVAFHMSKDMSLNQEMINKVREAEAGNQSEADLAEDVKQWITGTLAPDIDGTSPIAQDMINGHLEDVDWKSIVAHYMEKSGLNVSHQHSLVNPAPAPITSISEKIAVRVTFDNGDTLDTEINADIEGAKKYYLGRSFNLGGPNGSDKVKKAVSVEELGD